MRASVWVRRVGLELAAIGLPLAAVLWSDPPFGWSETAALVACALLPLRHVWAPLALLAGLWGLVGGLGWPPALVALYRLGRKSGRVSTTLPWLVLPIAAATTPVLVTQSLRWQTIALMFGVIALYVLAPAALGLLMSTRERLTASLRELEAARERAVAASQDAARAQERARIGREIHDAVGHHATLIAVGAAALAASTSDDETREAAERIRTLAKRALAEMRSALGLDGHCEPVAGLAEVDALVAGAHAVGVDVELEHDGEPVEVTPSAGRAVYRVVQEALTNAARHAPGAPVRVRLSWRSDELGVEVLNTAAPRESQPRPDRVAGGGAGLIGLTERAVSVGGWVSAGPALGDGFAVRATFPLSIMERAATLPA
jgi:signal transduction histidine kinase